MRRRRSAGIGTCRRPCCGVACASISTSVLRTFRHCWRDWARESECQPVVSVGDRPLAMSAVDILPDFGNDDPSLADRGGDAFYRACAFFTHPEDTEI